MFLQVDENFALRMGKKNRNKRKKSSDSDSNLGVYARQKKSQRKGGSEGDGEELTIGDIASIFSQKNEILSQTNGSPAEVAVFNSPESERSKEKGEQSAKVRSTHKEPQSKMASSAASGLDVSTKLDLVLKAVEGVKRNQDDLKTSLEKKIDKLRKDLIKDIDTKISVLKTDVKKDIERESERIDDLLKSVQDLQSRMTNIEVNGVVNNDGPLSSACDPLNDPNITVITSGFLSPKAN